MDQHDLRVGKLFSQFADQRCCDAGGDSSGQTDRYLAGLPGAGIFDVLVGALNLSENSTSIVEQPLTCFRQLNASSVPDEQTFLKLRFKVLNLSAECGLGHV